MVKNLLLNRTKLFWFLLLNVFGGFSQEWTWVKGPNTVNSLGNYGTQGTAAASNVPGSREGAATWTDNSGNLWIFGGNGHSSSAYGRLNDLWKLDPVTNTWTWIKGPNAVNQWASYGTMGTANPANNPGSRAYAVTWTDNSGDLWMFGGYGYDEAGNLNNLNDLWKYTISTNEWTWIGGTNLTYQYGVYGTLGVTSSTNIPGARRHPISWKDNSGNLWLFGGYGLSANGGEGSLNDLWKYTIAGNSWTWVHGGNNINQAGAYGIQGIPGSANTPGTRYGSAPWKDNGGNLWLFSGNGHDASGNGGYLNDVWRFNVSTNQWTWIKGSSLRNQASVFGTQSLPSGANTPGGRNISASWVDNEGNLYVQGGYGVSTNTAVGQNLNDMWKFNVSTNQWTWIRGVYYEIAGNYGTQGLTATSNDPGSGHFRASWKDNSGNFWLFGGNGYDVNSNFSVLGDLWKMNPCLPAAPVIVSGWSAQNICTGNSTTVSVISGANPVLWYSSPTGTTAFATGTTYVTPALTSGTATSASYTYYVAATNTCGSSAARTPVIATSYSIYPKVTTGTTYTQSMFIGNLQTIASNWSPAVFNFTDPLPPGAIITGVDLTYDGKDQGFGGTGAPADIHIADQRVALTALFHTWNPYNTTFTGPLDNYVYGGSNTFKFYFWGYPAWQGFLNNVNVVFRYQTKTPPSITACQNSSITLKAYGAVSYIWSGGITDGVPSLLTSTQVFTVSGTNIYGCVNTATQLVNATPAPTLSISGNTSVCIGGSISQTVSGTGADTYSWSTGATTSTISDTPVITTTYVTVGTNTLTGCYTPVSNVVVVNPLPTVSINSGTLCSGKVFTLVPSGASSYTYSGGSNLVSPLTSTNYSVSGSDAFGCVSAAAAVASIAVYASPTVVVNSGAICAGESFTIVPGGAISYSFSSSSSVVSPASTASYSVTGSSAQGCISNIAVSGITVNPLPLLSITGPTAVCTGSTISQTVSGADTYSWSTGSTGTGISISPTVNSTYTVSGTNTLTGCSAAVSRIISVGYPPVITVNSGNVCAGGVFTMVPSGAATYTFSNGSGTVLPTVSPMVNTSYFVSGTSALGCVSTASAISNVVVNAAPVIVVNSGGVCAGNVFTMVPSGASTYTFSNGSATVMPLSNASYSVMGTSILGCVSAVPGIANVTVNSVPVVTAVSGTVCSGSIFTIVPGGAATYTYSSGTSMVSPSNNTNYSVTGTSAQGCISSNTAVLTVSVIALPIISVNSNTLCSGNTFTMIPSGASTYTYSNGSSTVIPFANASYSVTGTNSLGCVSLNAAVANVTLLPIPTVSVNSGVICAGKIFTMTPSGASTYTFSGSSSTVSPSVNTSYSVTGTNSLGCISSNVAISNVVVNPLPFMSIIGTATICSGENTSLIATGATTYTWSTNALGSTQSFSPANTATYTVSGTNSNGCVNSTTIQITVNPSPTLSLNSGTVCPSSTFVIVPSGGVTYTYSGGSDIVAPSVTTTYSVTGTDANGCVSAFPAVTTITVVNTISVSVSGTTLMCLGNTATLTASGANSYTWNTGEFTGTIAPAPTASSTFTVVGANGTCSDTAFISVQVNPLPEVLISSTSSLICTGESATLVSTGAHTYTWDSGESTATVVINPVVSTNYTVTGLDVNGCSNKAVITLSVSDCAGFEPALNLSSLINVYPNPNNGEFVIEMSVPLKVSVINSLGQLITEQQLVKGKNKITLTQEARGIYFVELTSERQTKTVKMLKQ